MIRKIDSDGCDHNNGECFEGSCGELESFSAKDRSLTPQQLGKNFMIAEESLLFAVEHSFAQ